MNIRQILDRNTVAFYSDVNDTIVCRNCATKFITLERITEEDMNEIGCAAAATATMNCAVCAQPIGMALAVCANRR